MLQQKCQAQRGNDVKHVCSVEAMYKKKAGKGRGCIPR